jgi:DnaK suppressor protein
VIGADPTTRDVLAAERQRTLEQIAALMRDFAGIVEAAAGVATDDEHDPEGATIAFERAQVSALLSQSRDRLAALEHALVRVEDGSYGACERCGRPIAPERLAARPDAATCIDCASTRR